MFIVTDPSNVAFSFIVLRLLVVPDQGVLPSDPQIMSNMQYPNLGL